MKPIVDSFIMDQWIKISGDVRDEPFEELFGANFIRFSFADFTALFLPETIKAACMWSLENELQPFAMFFTNPEPVDYFIERGIYGGVVATGEDDPEAILSFLTDDNRWAGHFSVYDASHRFFMVPATRNWMVVGDRDADLAIFGFESSSQQDTFMKNLSDITFDSMEDAAVHAKSFMRYNLRTSRFHLCEG
jgi:hypothetical protein